MAKRKKRAHTHRHHRRRRMGAASLNPASPVVMLGALAAGYFAGDTINAFLDKYIPDIGGTPATGTTPAVAPTIDSTTIAMVAELGLGALLLLRKGKKTLIKTALGGIIGGAGIKRALVKFDVVSGYQAVPVIGRHRMAGYQSVPVIGGIPGQLQGMTPSQLQGFRVNGPGNGYRPAGSRAGLNVLGSVNPYHAEPGSGINNTGGGEYMS